MFKRVLAVVLCLAVLLCSCSGKSENSNPTEPTQDSDTASVVAEIETEQISSAWLESYYDEEYAKKHFSSLNDEELLSYVEDVVYAETVASLDSEEYFVENVSAVYISQEYLDEIAFNSQSNIFFGYTLEELDEVFQGARYVFTLGEDGQTGVQELIEIEDETFENVLKDVTIGTGVILLCVTVSVVSGGLGAPAVATIFSFSAKAGATAAISSAVLGGVTAGVVRGVETGDMEEALTAAALAGGEGFKWGAISGAVSGGISKTIDLKGATMNGLTMNEAALIQKESNLPSEFIKNFHSLDEYKVYKEAGLQLIKINGKWAYSQKIDWTLVDSDGRTNVERINKGLNPIDSTGASYEVHHIGQMPDSPYAILTKEQHKKYYSILHKNTGTEATKIDRTEFNAEKKVFWKKYYEGLSE